MPTGTSMVDKTMPATISVRKPLRFVLPENLKPGQPAQDTVLICRLRHVLSSASFVSNLPVASVQQKARPTGEADARFRSFPDLPLNFHSAGLDRSVIRRMVQSEQPAKEGLRIAREARRSVTSRRPHRKTCIQWPPAVFVSAAIPGGIAVGISVFSIQREIRAQFTARRVSAGSAAEPLPGATG